MKVLDIYPNYCWSLHGPNAETIMKLRAAVSIADEQTREHALHHIPEGEAFRFVGDPASLQLAKNFFDEVRLTFTPVDVAKRVQLRQCIRRWSKGEQLEIDVGQPEIRSESLDKLPVSRFFREWVRAGRLFSRSSPRQVLASRVG